MFQKSAMKKEEEEEEDEESVLEDDYLDDEGHDGRGVADKANRFMLIGNGEEIALKTLDVRAGRRETLNRGSGGWSMTVLPQARV